MSAITKSGLVHEKFFKWLMNVLVIIILSFETTTAQTILGGVNMGNLTDYLFVYTNGSVDANWQGATSGFVGNVAINGISARERTSGAVPYAGTIYTNDVTLGAWQAIVDQNAAPNVIPSQAFSSTGQTTLITNLTADLNNAFSQINALIPTTGYTSVSSASLNGLNTQNGVAETFVINITSGLQVSTQINITGDPGDIFILRWDSDGNPNNGYQGQTKFQSGGAIVPKGGLKPTNFINVAGDIASSGGGSNPPSPYPQGPRLNDGTGSLITNGTNYNGGGFFTGYWLTTGDPATGQTSSLSNATFVGGWYSTTNKFSMTSGTRGVYVTPPTTLCIAPGTPVVNIAQSTCTVTTGTITVISPTGAGLTYSIDGVNYTNTTGVFSGLAPGSYTVTVKNSSDCISAPTVAVINAQPPTPAAPVVNITQPTCTVATGTITVTSPTGAGLTYSIDGVDYTNTTGVFSGLAPGSYNVTVKNNSGCISSPTVAVINAQPSTPAAPVVSIIQPTCTVATGTITVTSPTGAGLTYSINGTTYQSSTIFSGLAPGSYNVTVKNSSGCISSPTVAVINAQPSTPAAPVVSITQPTCTVATGIITVTSPTGAGLTYSINGTTYQSSTIFSGLAPGSYNVTVKNSSGCISSPTVAVINAQPSTPAAPVVSITQPTCTVATGTITVTSPTGAGLTYSINGTTYQSGTIFSGLAPGSYNVTVKNTSGCISPATVAVINQPAACAGIFHTTVTCNDFESGANGQLVGQLCYATRSDKVSNVTPGQFFYYTFITAPSASFCVDITETKSCTDLDLFSINQGNQLALYDVNCNNVATGTQITLGNGRICITNAVAGAQYVVSVKYDSKSIVGSSVTGTPHACTYTFVSRINGVDQPNSSASINLIPGCSQSALTARDAFRLRQLITVLPGVPAPSVTAYPNPFMNELNFRMSSSVSGRGILELYDVTGKRIAIVFEGNLEANIFKTVTYSIRKMQGQLLFYTFTIGDNKVHGKLFFGGIN